MCAVKYIYNAVDDVTSLYKYDVQVNFEKQQPIERIDALIKNDRSVECVEYWNTGSGKIHPKYSSDKKESSDVSIVAVPTDSSMIMPKIVSGRWFLKGDENAAIVPSVLLEKFPYLSAGDVIAIEENGKYRKWIVAGIYQSSEANYQVFVPEGYYAECRRSTGWTTAAQIKLCDNNLAATNEFLGALEELLNSKGIKIANSSISLGFAKRTKESVAPIMKWFVTAAMLIAFAGTVVLAGTMSVSVAERIKEIGTLRAIGASTSQIKRIFLFEGMVICISAWFLSVIATLFISWPIAKLINIVLKSRLDYDYSWEGAFIWLVISLLCGFFATIIAANRASSITVSKALTYE